MNSFVRKLCHKTLFISIFENCLSTNREYIVINNSLESKQTILCISSTNKEVLYNKIL
jgi:hypothetical protein